MSYFIGFTISGLIIPIAMDKYGRKYVFLGGRFITGIAFAVILFLPEYPEVYIVHGNIIKGMILVTGIFACTQGITGVNLYCESTTDKSQSTMITIWLCCEGGLSILLPLYYWLVSNNWIYPIAFSVGLQAVLLIVGLIYLEESPKWLYE